MRRNRNARKPAPRNTERRQHEKRELSMLSDLITVSKVTANVQAPRVPDVPRMILARDKVYTFSRNYFYPTDLVGTTANDATGGYAFSLDSAPAPTDFTNLFEEYRIAQISVTFVPSVTSGENTLLTAFDYDSIEADSRSAILQRQTLEMVTSGGTGNTRSVTRTFIPRVRRLVYETTESASYEPAKSLWLDDLSPSVPHYGLKAMILQLSGGAQAAYKVYINMVVQCRYPK